MTHVDNPFESPAVLSVCTGIRGLERGVERAIGTIRTVAYVEIEAFITENLLVGMEAGILVPTPIWSNLKTFNPLPFRGKVHGIIGGYPCQPFSTAGKRKGTDDPRHLWPYIKRCVNAIKPVWIFFENVAGHVTLGFEEVANSLRAMGYAIEAGIFTAEEVGAPHLRKRIFILGILDDTRSAEWRKNYSLRIRRERDNICGLRQEDSARFEQPGTELANPDCLRAGTDTGGSFQKGSENEGETQWKKWDSSQRERSRADLGDDGPIVGDSSRFTEREPSDKINPVPNEGGAWTESGGTGKLADTGVKRFEAERVRAESSGRGENLPRIWSSTERGGDRWPARPGEQQFDWELPRTIESSMGCTFNGYNFREDFLRALGNGVVEQQAELAFRDLIRKHFER